MFVAATWSAICTDGTFEDAIASGWTELCTDGIFTWYVAPTPSTGKRSIICVHLKTKAKVGCFYG